MSITVFLADDHAVVREGIRAVLEKKANDITVVGEASNGNQALEFAKHNHADVYILDIAMPVLNGMETARRLLKKARKRRVILLSMHDNRTFVEQALETGVSGYVLKESASDEVINAIREVNEGRYYLTPKISKYLVQGFLGKSYKAKTIKKAMKLTPREREVLQLISEGFTNKDIARKLNRSVNTIHIHRNNVMQKLDIHNQADLVRYALKEGISSL
jgi:DNA-binding NarL/FixJ family response regulator